MMILYDKTETNFTHNGLAVLDNNVISPVVHEELNGLFSLAFDFPIHAKDSEKLLPEMLVKVPVPNMNPQLFRIVERSDVLGGLLHIVAHHIFYDLAKNIIEDTFIVNKNGTQALSQLLGATQYAHSFTGTSNISTVNNVRLVRLNPVEILLDSDLENGFQTRYEGEIVRDNFSIAMLSSRGANNGVQIRDKKNLTGYQSDLDYSSVVTRIMPEGYDGLFLPEKYVDSPLINSYVSPKIKVIKYDKVKVGNDEGEFATKELAYAKLRELANLEFSQNNLDKPNATYEVTFAPLEKTEEYKHFSALETVSLGDTVSVIHEEDGLNVTARVMSYTYDPILQAYISVTLGNILPKFTDIAKVIKRVDTKVTQVQDDANYALTAANGKNTNFYGTSTPNNPKLGDVWYKENGDKLEMWVYETREGITQWFPLMTDLTQEEVKQAVEQAKQESTTALENANTAYENVLTALNQTLETNQTVETLETTVTQNSSQIALVASGMTNLGNRVTTAESSLTVQAGQIASKANQSSVDTLTGRVTTAESAITQNAETFNLSLSKQNKAINDLTGANILQSTWQQGNLNTSNGVESTSSSYVRSDYFDVKEGEKYLLQSFNGKRLYATYGTLYLFYYRADKTFLSYSSFGNTTIPFTVPTDAKYLRIRVTTTNAPSTVDCYLLQTDKENGYTDLSSLSNVAKLTATADALMLSVSETKTAIGTPFQVKTWQQGSLSTTDGTEISASNSLRSTFIDVAPNEKYIGQMPDGTAITIAYHYYGYSTPYIDFVPSANQYVETLTIGNYTNDTIASYLQLKNVESLTITATPTSNHYSNSGDYLTIYKLPLDGKTAPNVLTWNGRKDTSDNTVWLYTGESWEQIATVTATSNTIHTWVLTEQQRANITENVYLAFFSIKNENYAGIYNATTSPFLLNPEDEHTLYQISYTNSSASVTVPSNAVKMRVRTTTTLSPDNFQGNVYLATTRVDYTKVNSLYSSLLMTKDLINLRVAKGEIINQINVSPESILIAGNKIHITGQTTIDSAVITTAMMKDLSVTNAKIADATISSAKIASLDAGKITTGYLSAARIAANSITADKLSANILTAITASSSIRITGTTIGYYSGDTLVTEINSQGMTIRRDGTTVGRIGANNISGHSDWRGLVFDLDYGTEYMSWAHKETSSASTYTQQLTWYASSLSTTQPRGFSFDDNVYLNKEFGIVTTAGTNRAKLARIGFDSVYHMAITSIQGGAGIAFASSNLMVCDDGIWVDFGIIRSICQKLAGKTIALPSAINSSGVVTSWYSPITFNSMTTYS
ncbi:phage minor structural protein, N-terminal region [Pilibacter termitis]|uniref:Phage minor structural protein, N-terminal region n=1 Tax=Pilibacter termitis TaxID=263852 RepID=A0A1T4R716_9ENTE|nr:phage tail spike protein [Pilibacter termitis]SKA11616.1 phage minor structural protein, N-terminal region [Pilibacter termitis]